MFRCKVCGWLHAGDVPPDNCPSCGSPADRFRPVSTSVGSMSPGADIAPTASDRTASSARLRLLALVPATIDSPFARHDGPMVDVVTGDGAWFDDNIPCMRACPVNTDVATYIAHVADGAFGRAAALNREQNVFAGTLGRACSRPCEDACRRVVVDNPIQIRALKRVATDRAGEVEVRPSSRNRLSAAATGRQVAVVGAGVAGLTVARELRNAGHAVTVFERESRPGGLMVSGVPAWRLPREVVATDIDAITALGITIRTGMTLGQDLSVAELGASFDAVAVATGAQRRNRLDMSEPSGPASDAGVTDGLAFLRRAADGGWRPSGPVVVIGGGYTAFDCARTARRLAPGAVTIAMRTAAGQVAMAEELGEAIAEGITVETGVAVVGIERNGATITGVLLADEIGSRRTLPCALLIAALGQRPDRSMIDRPGALDAAEWPDLATGAGQVAGWPNTWLAGDVVAGSSSFIKAIASAKRAAGAIDRWLTGDEDDAAVRSTRVPTLAAADIPIPMEPASDSATGGPGDDDGIPSWTRNLLHRRIIEDEPYRSIPAQATRLRPPDERGLASGDAAVEVDRGLTAEIGREEAARCLQCQANIFIDGDRCILCNGCVDVCPAGCIAMLGLDRLASVDGGAPHSAHEPGARTVAMVIDEDTCIRCGKCVDWCPTSCITMSAHRPTIAGQPTGFDLRSLLTEG